MHTLLAHPALRTSSMLFADSYTEHLQIYRRLFTDTDVVLDVGCGPDGSDLQFDGIDIESDPSTVDFSKYNTLNFSESLGYLSLHEILDYISKTKARKIVVKDFLCIFPVVVPYFNYNFQMFYTQIIPVLLTSGYEMQIKHFNPSKKRWKSLLESCGLQYFQAPGIYPVIGIFTKNG